MEYIGSPSIASTYVFLKSIRPLRNFAEADSHQESLVNSEKQKKCSAIRPMFIAAGCSLLLAVAMGIATGYSAPATYDMQFRANSMVKPTKSEITWVGSMLALGAMIGGFCAGFGFLMRAMLLVFKSFCCCIPVASPVADKIGRKDTLIFNLVPFALGWLTICYAKTVISVIIGRFVCGLACGVISVTVPMYCVEISTPDVRGKLGSAFQGFMVTGSLISATVGSFVTWEYLALSGAIFSIFGVICFAPMPESPRWLLAKGKLDEAISVMDKLQDGFVNAEKECNTIYEDLKSLPKGMLSLKECKNPIIYKPALIAFALMFFQQFSGANAVLFNSSIIFEAAKDFMDPKKSTIVLGAFQVVATLLSNLIVDKAGRRLFLMLSGIFMALSLIALGTFYYIASTDTSFQIKYSWVPLVSLILFVNAFSIGYGPIPWLLAAEMVPVRARSTVGGLATISNGLFAFIVTKTFSEIEDLVCSYGTYWFYSSLAIIGTIFVFYAVPETKGKRLEDIEKLFQGKEAKRTEQIISVSVIT